ALPISPGRGARRRRARRGARAV
ncbi:MAG: hypothetical protein AVDCRST_MAG04-3132, partial [uncultured Acetobacteraceae bacterium]